jgi:hypothetical protein
MWEMTHGHQSNDPVNKKFEIFTRHAASPSPPLLLVTSSTQKFCIRVHLNWDIPRNALALFNRIGVIDSEGKIDPDKSKASTALEAEAAS